MDYLLRLSRLPTIMAFHRNIWNNSIVIFCILTLLPSGLSIMCSVCQSDYTDEDWTCMTHPPPAENCTRTCLGEGPDGECMQYIEYPYCVTVKKYDENETLLSYSRTCYPTTGPNHCTPGVDKELNMDVILCSEFCSTDNCNSAFTLQPHPFLLLLPILVTVAVFLNNFSDGCTFSLWR